LTARCQSFASEGAAKVLLVVRGSDLSKMSTYLSRRVQACGNIEILFNTEIRKMSGNKMLEEAELENTRTGQRRVIKTPAIFSMIGANPCTEWLPTEIERDDKGFIRTGAEVAAVSEASSPVNVCFSQMLSISRQCG
jgi:thioredoxin reductase (NADPH)